MTRSRTDAPLEVLVHQARHTRLQLGCMPSVREAIASDGGDVPALLADLDAAIAEGEGRFAGVVRCELRVAAVRRQEIALCDRMAAWASIFRLRARVAAVDFPCAASALATARKRLGRHQVRFAGALAHLRGLCPVLVAHADLLAEPLGPALLAQAASLLAEGERIDAAGQAVATDTREARRLPDLARGRLIAVFRQLRHRWSMARARTSAALPVPAMPFDVLDEASAEPAPTVQELPAVAT